MSFHARTHTCIHTPMPPLPKRAGMCTTSSSMSLTFALTCRPPTRRSRPRSSCQSWRARPPRCTAAARSASRYTSSRCGPRTGARVWACVCVCGWRAGSRCASHPCAARAPPPHTQPALWFRARSVPGPGALACGRGALHGGGGRHRAKGVTRAWWRHRRGVAGAAQHAAAGSGGCTGCGCTC
jgi:hypothetical protein